jgi:hypothetical protein
MIQHIVLLKWKTGTTEAQIEDAFAQMSRLLDGIDDVQRITFGRNRGSDDHGYTHALIVRLTDEHALDRYLANPVRLRYVSDVLGPIEQERIELDLPEEARLERGATASLRWDWAGTTRTSAAAAAAALRWEESQTDA